MEKTALCSLLLEFSHHLRNKPVSILTCSNKSLLMIVSLTLISGVYHKTVVDEIDTK